MTNNITPKTWFYIMSIHSQNETDQYIFSCLEILSLLASVASVSVPNIPTYLTITQMFNVCHQCKFDTSKTLSILK